MPKTPEMVPPHLPMTSDEPVTPGPEITVEPLTPMPVTDPAAFIPTPPPQAVVPQERSMDRNGRPDGGADGAGPRLQARTPTPVPSSWAAQPLTPMPEEATVPLPVEEVEFADSEGDLGPIDDDPLPTPASAETRAAARGGAAGRPTPPPMPLSDGALRGGGPMALSADGAALQSTSSGRPALPSAAARPLPPPAPVADVPAKRPPAPGAPSTVVPLLPPGATWSEALSQRPRKKRLKPWFEEVFDEDYLRTLPFMTPEQTLREVAFIKDSLRPPAEGELLDVACGYGRHAIELGQGGHRVTGIDLSLPLLIRAADEAQRRSLSVNFVHADMREMAFENQFDGAYSFLTSFGYFDEDTNLKVASSIFRSLKPGGRFLLDTINRDYIVSDLPTRVWWEGDGCVVLEEVDFNFQTSRLTVRRSIVFQDGRQVEHDISIRAYSLHELSRLVRQAGFRVVEISGGIATKGHFFSSTSRSVILLCERPND